MTQLVNVSDEIRKLETPFGKVNGYGLDFRSEALFARQQIVKSDYILTAAQNNPQALANAILNVAAVGISLNPASRHAYLVPRAPQRGQPPQICLDISYLGLVKLATDSGAVAWAKAELVFEGDEFTWRGMTELPLHEFDPFDPDRMDMKNPLAKLRGGYCVAKLPDGTWMIDRMTAAEILKVKDTSMAGNGPWKTWPEEMAKKTLVKRASKSWPQSDGRHRLDDAVRVLNEHEGLEKADPVEEDKLVEFLNLVATGTPVQVLSFMSEASEQLQVACYNTAPKGEKVKFKERVTGMMREAREYIGNCAASIAELAENGDPAALAEYDDLDDRERALADIQLTDITHRQLAELRSEEAAA